MACEVGCCSSCVFTLEPGDEDANGLYCKLDFTDEILEEKYGYSSYDRVCALYQLNPKVL